MRVQTYGAALALMVAVSMTAAFAQARAGAETFTAKAQVKGAASGTGAVADIEIRLREYSPEDVRADVEKALRYGGYPSFLKVLRDAPEVGTVVAGTRSAPIRWAREQPAGKGRRIVVVTDQPLYFIGAGAADAKPRAGYELALIELNVDAAGAGTGTMAAAARVKPDGKGGVIVDDYADKPIELLSVARKGA